MQLFYNESIEQDAKDIFFDKEESKHIVKVLRKRLGDTLYITNGKGIIFEGKISIDDEKKCVVSICNSKTYTNKNYYLHLAVAPTKNNERYEWFLEKATEIGVDEITPIICKHSERITFKNERFEKIIVSAMKQSLQSYKPTLNEPISFTEFMNKKWEETAFIAHCENSIRKELVGELHQLQPKKILILIGPEGDFSSSEIEIALKKGFVPIVMGENRLRTETAAVVACHTVSLIDTLQQKI